MASIITKCCRQCWHEPDTNFGMCQRCHPEYFHWDEQMGTKRKTKEELGKELIDG